jgi:uncharacterized protein YaaN involved in tellurite resistance
MSEEELKRVLAANEEFAVAEKNNEAFQTLRTEVERHLREIDALLPRVRDFLSASDFGQDALKKVETQADRARRAIQMQDLGALRDVREKLERAAQMLKGVADRASG